MKKQTIIWTALPNGQSNGQLRLSVLVSPRLQPDANSTLDQFADFLDWHQHELEFDVIFKSGSQTKTVTATRKTPPPDEQLWPALFKTDTFVRRHEFKDLSKRSIRSYPATQVMRFLKQRYQKVAAEPPTDLPRVVDIAREEAFGQIDFDWRIVGASDDPAKGVVVREDRERTMEREVSEHIDQVLKKHRAVPRKSAPDPRLDFYQVRQFHRPHNKAIQPKSTQSPRAVNYERAKVVKPKIDFHEMLAALGAYPEIMRKLGLVIDLEVPAAGLPAQGTVRIQPRWSPALTTENSTPRTHFTKGFRPKAGSAGSDIKGGMLRLDDEKDYGVVQVDLDGAALKSMNFATTTLRSLSHYRSADTPDRTSVPSMRSAGLSVVKIDRASRLVQTLDRALDKNKKASGDKVELFAEDLVRGYRIDVLDNESGAWHSLCRRVGTYDFQDANVKLTGVEDEGFVTMGVTESADQTSPDLYVTESLFRWTGWSLCAPRPGTRLNFDQEPERFDNQPQTEFRFVASFTPAKNSLPRLRFGAQYRLRARVVDLAGNSLQLEEANATAATKSQAYLRFEPVTSPTFAQRKKLDDATPGESTERLVVRTFNETPALDSQPSSEISERHVAPPLSAQLHAETHGKFDTPTGLNKAAYNMIVNREGELEDVHPEAQLKLPYLPDPICRGAVFLGQPGESPRSFLGLPGAVPNEQTDWHGDGTNTVTDLTAMEKPPITLVRVDFGKDEQWPDLQPFLLRVQGIVEPDDPKDVPAPKWNAEQRVLTVFVPQAMIARVRLSSYFDEEVLRLTGIWKWIEESGLPAVQLDRLAYYAIQGRHWMLTPFRELTLVHAVQQPLKSPAFPELTPKNVIKKAIGDTFAQHHYNLALHARSTEKIDVHAEWSEPIDALSEPGPQPKIISGKAHAFEVPVPYPYPLLGKNWAEENLGIYQRHEFGDTKHRKVTYTATATTRFREYLPFKKEDMEESNGQPAKHPVTRISETKTVDVLNSARPAAPKVLYIVPTFGWERATSPTGLVSRRRGDGLRVYLERPWYSSGEGELLGVVLYRPRRLRLPRSATLAVASGKIPDRLKSYVTQWGKDPIYASANPKALPATSDFTAAVQSQSNLTLDELSATDRFSVAGHEVQYDPDRGLWYCDIEIEAGSSYYPFVRLALARYQPKSIANAHLSRVVLADFAQLAPDRTAIVTYSTDKRELFIKVLGVQPSETGVSKALKTRSQRLKLGTAVELQRPPSNGLNQVTVAVETLDPEIGTDLGWKPVEGAKVTPDNGKVSIKATRAKHTVSRLALARDPKLSAVQLLDPRIRIIPQLIWSGKVTLPEPFNAQKYRLVIQEFENFFADARQTPNTTHLPTAQVDQRLVYADVVEL